MVTVLFLMFTQLPYLAIMPSIDIIHKHVYIDKTIAEIQTALMLNGIVAVFSGILTSFLIQKSIISKKAAVVWGTAIGGLTGVIALLFHTQFWQLIMCSTILGIGFGASSPNTQSILMDTFDEQEVHFISGIQFSCLNAGGIVFSLLGGFIVSPAFWYAGYVVLLVTLPVSILSAITIKSRKTPKEDKRNKTRVIKPTKLPRDVYYYFSLSLVYAILQNVSTSNLATHLRIAEIGDAGTAGAATALMLGGGVLMGLLFQPISKKFGDYTISASFSSLAIGLTALNLFSHSIIIAFAAMFIIGLGLTLMLPQVAFSVSRLVDETNSATASMLLACISPGAGTFFSPVIITNITSIFSGSTNFRYQFTGFLALAVALFAAINTKRRASRGVRG